MSATNTTVKVPLAKGDRLFFVIAAILLALAFIACVGMYTDSVSTGRVLDGKVAAVSEMQQGSGTFDVPYVTVRLEGSNEELECYFNAEENCKSVQPGNVATLSLNKLHGRVDSMDIR